MMNDLRFAFRRLRRSPGFTIAAVTSLALALGATVGLFAVVDAVLLRPLPYADADRLVAVRSRVDGISPSPWGLSQAQYFDFEQHASSLERIGAYVTNDFALADDQAAERVSAALVSASLFDVLQVHPLLGRLIHDEDAQPAPSRAVLLGYDFWTRRFGGDRAVIGRTVEIEAVPREIVGVLPAGFDLPDRKTAVWLALPLDRSAPPVNAHFLEAIARLRPGTSIDQARADLDRRVRQFSEIFPQAYPVAFMRESRFAADVVPLHETVVGGTKRMLWILFGAAGLVLLIACANVANLFLVRMQDRWHELAIRRALGAESRHLVRHSMTEALMLTLAAGVLGIQVAEAALQGLLALEAVALPRIDQIALGWRAVLFTLGVCAAAGVALGLLPVIRMHRGRSLAPLHRGLTGSRDVVRTRNALVVAQVALTVVLLAAGGLMARSFANLARVDPGFDPSGVLAVSVSLPAARYTSHDQASRFYEAFLERIRALPGVASAGATTALPLSGAGGCAALFIEDAPLTPGENPPCLPVRRVTPGYFQTLGIGVHGNTPGWSEVNTANAGAVVTRALADRLWPMQDPIGKGIRGAGWARPFYRVVGVTENVREAGLNEPPIEAAYFPMIPLDGAPLWTPARAMTVVVRVHSGTPEAMASAVRGVMNELDAAVPLGQVIPMSRVIERSTARTRLVMLLLGLAAGLALFLGTIGLYSVLAYSVSRKQKEIGIRTALGCGRGEVAALVMREALALTAVGLAAGFIAAVLTTKMLEGLLFGVTALDPLTFAAVGLLLVTTALLASYLPARRAASVDPVIVLRVD